MRATARPPTEDLDSEVTLTLYRDSESKNGEKEKSKQQKHDVVITEIENQGSAPPPPF